jgi:hypothetical protein
MTNEEKFIQEVKGVLDAAVERGKEAEKALPAASMTNEQVDNELKRMEHQVELTRNRAENITSRYQAGIINKDVAKKQMKNLLTEECTQLISDMIRFKGVAPNTEVTVDQIKEAMRKINISFS